MEPIFDKTGQFVGWLASDVIYDTRRRPRAFVQDSGVFSYRGGHLGFLLDGIIRDRQAEAIAFMTGHEPGPTPPLPPVPESPLTPPTPARLPAQPAPQRQPIPPGHWSDITWERFIDSRS